MTNSALMHKALEYRRIRATMKLLEAEAKAHSDAVVAELAKRGGLTPEEAQALFADDEAVSGPARRKLLTDTAPIVHRGLTVTPKASTRTTWAAEALRELVSRSTFGRVSHTVVDNDLMKAELKAGRVDLATVVDARTETVGSPYIVVSGDPA